MPGYEPGASLSLDMDFTTQLQSSLTKTFHSIDPRAHRFEWPGCRKRRWWERLSTSRWLWLWSCPAATKCWWKTFRRSRVRFELPSYFTSSSYKTEPNRTNARFFKNVSWFVLCWCRCWLFLTSVPTKLGKAGTKCFVSCNRVGKTGGVGWGTLNSTWGQDHSPGSSYT